MWGYENDNEFYEYAISKVLEHKADELEQKEFNKFLNNEKIDDRDYNLIKNNTEVYNLKFKKVRRSIL